LGWIVFQNNLFHLDGEIVSLLHHGVVEPLFDNLDMLYLFFVTFFLELLVPYMHFFEYFEILRCGDPFASGDEFLHGSEDFVVV